MPDTGWKELIDIGWNRVASPGNLFACYQSMVLEENKKSKKNVYGDGKAGEKIVDIIKKESCK